MSLVEIILAVTCAAFIWMLGGAMTVGAGRARGLWSIDGDYFLTGIIWAAWPAAWLYQLLRWVAAVSERLATPTPEETIPKATAKSKSKGGA